MARTRELKVLVVGDASSAQRALRGLDTTMGKTSRSMGAQMRDFAYRARFVGVAVAGGVGYAIKAAAEAEKVTAQTEAALKSTGAVANITSEEIQGLAEEVMDYSGISDEAIQSTANLVLTFKNIRNEAGESNDIFNQTTKAIVDMSVAMDKDLNSSAIMVGKALNDPIAGISAMGRAGVQFSTEQKAMITSLVETGDLLSAQKIILAELESQFGDSAKAAGETTAGQFAILREKTDNLAESMGNNLAPALNAAADAGIYLLDSLPGEIDDILGAPGDKAKALEPYEAQATQFKNQLREGILTASEYNAKVEDTITALNKEAEATGSLEEAKESEQRIRLAASNALAQYNTESSRSVSAIDGQVAALGRLEAKHLALIRNLKEIERLGVPGALLAGAGLPYTGTSTTGGTGRGSGRKKVLMPGTYD